MKTDLIAYYKERAGEYEKIYHKPERQDDLGFATRILTEKFSGKNVLEIACGTGFWTERLARTALSIDGVDLNESMLEIARQKQYGNCKVNFSVRDILLDAGAEKYEGVFGGFIWSHIPRQNLRQFLTTVTRSVIPGGLVVFMDNNFVEGSNTPVAESDTSGNTYQLRRLGDGSEHLVLKNFPAEDFLREQLAERATDVEVIRLKYFWLLCFRTPAC